MKLSKKIEQRLKNLHYVGFFTVREAEEKGMRLVTGREGKLCLYWLVDEADGIIADAKFQVFGPIGLIAAAETISELALRKNYDQVSRISADLIDQHMRDKKDIPAFPPECATHLNQILSAIDRAVHQCLDIPFAATYETTPIESDFPEIPGGLPGWDAMSDAQKKGLIEELIEREIRPYIELDAGGVRVIAFREGNVHIAYEGACTSCHAATGSTLSAIQQILQARLHPSLVVIPEISPETSV